MTLVLLCAALGVALRLAVSWAAADAGVFADMAQYQERAQHMASTGTLWPDALRGPGYPALLALSYRVLGDSLWTARLVNAAVGGVLVLLTGVLAGASGAGRRAWVASAIVAAYPSLVLSSVYVMPEGWYAALVVATLVAVRHRSAVYAVAAGAMAGAAILTRSVGVALLAVPMALWLRAVVRGEASWRVAMARVALFAAACGVVLLPWLVFTARTAGGPLLDETSGFNLLAGNNPRATGRLELDDVEWLRTTYMAGAPSAADGNARAMAAGLSWAVSHPGAWVGLAAKKIGYLFGLEGREHAWGYGHGYFGPRSATTVVVWGALLLVSFPLLCVAAGIGVARAAGPLRPVHVAIAVTLAATTALHVLSFGESRFHLPLVPLLAALASLGGQATGAGVGRRMGTGTGTRQDPEVARAAASPARAVAVALVLALLAAAWLSQAQESLDALNRLRAPGGWASRPPY